MRDHPAQKPGAVTSRCAGRHAGADAGVVAMDEGPLRELAALVEELSGDDQRLLELTEELAAFKKKLPAELLSDAVGEEPLRLEEPWRSGTCRCGSSSRWCWRWGCSPGWSRLSRWRS